MTVLIKDRAQARRTARPTAHGLHPQVAERLRAFGIDPEEHAANIALARGVRRTKRGAAEGLSLAARALPGLALSRGSNALELSLDPNDVRVTPLLNQAALAYEDNQYVSDVVAPVQLTGERSAKYKIWDRGPFRALQDFRIGPNGSAKEISPTLSEDNYSVVRRAAKAFANNDTAMANPSLGVRAAAVEQVMEEHLLNREYDVAQMFHTSGNYTGSSYKSLTSGGGGTNWKLGSAATPIADMLGQQELIPGPVTHCVVSDIVWHVIQQTSDIKEILASQLENKGLLRAQDFSLYFGIPNMLITSADYRTAAGARTRLWSETGLWMGSVNSGMDRRTFCRTFRLRQGAGGWVTKTWRDEDRGENGGDWVRTAYAEDRKIVDPTYGAVIAGII